MFQAAPETNSSDLLAPKVDALMANIIVQIAGNDQFREDMSERLGKAVDTSVYEDQVERLTKQIKNKANTLKNGTSKSIR